MTNHLPNTLIIGATGKTGRRVADQLEALGYPVRRGSRRASPSFDWMEPDGWAAALDGMDQAYVTFQPDLAVPGATDAIAGLCNLAQAQGLKRLVLLSGRGEAGAQACERILQNSGLEWTIVRASWFAQNFSEGVLAGPVGEGVVALPVGRTREAFIDIDDIAEIVTAALSTDDHINRLYEVSGPELLSFDEAMAHLSHTLQRPVRFQPISPAQYEDGLLAAGVPADFAAFLVDLMTTTLDGRNEYVADGVQRALGRPATDFKTFVARAHAAGSWS